MSDFDFQKMNSALQKSLEKIGRTNGSAPPSSQDPIDELMHYYWADKLGEKFFKDSADRSKTNLIAAGGEVTAQKIKMMMDSTAKNMQGESGIIMQGAHYSLSLQTRKPAMKLNTQKLRTKLTVDHKIPVDVLEKLFEECSEPGNPTQIYSVQPVR